MSRLSPEEVVLGLLAPHGGYGYQLLEQFKPPAPLAAIWQMGTSQLYALLRRLEASGHIDGREVFPPDAPPRTEYFVTPPGRARLLNWLYDPFPSASTRAIRTMFLSRLYIAEQMAIDPALILESQREACRAALQRMQADRAASVSPLVSGLALDLKIAEQRLILDWLADAEHRCTAEFPPYRENAP